MGLILKPPTTYWNYRVLAHDNHKEVVLMIHEVHYRFGKPRAYADPAATVRGDTKAGMRWSMSKMREALTKPTLSIKNWPKEYKPKKIKRK